MIGIRNSIFSSSIYGRTTLTAKANVSMSSWNSMSQNNALRWETWLKKVLSNSTNLVHHSIHWIPWGFDMVIYIFLQTPWWTINGSPRSPSLAIIFHYSLKLLVCLLKNAVSLVTTCSWPRMRYIYFTSQIMDSYQIYHGPRTLASSIVLLFSNLWSWMGIIPLKS